MTDKSKCVNNNNKVQLLNHTRYRSSGFITGSSSTLIFLDKKLSSRTSRLEFYIALCVVRTGRHFGFGTMLLRSRNFYVSLTKNNTPQIRLVQKMVIRCTAESGPKILTERYMKLCTCNFE